MDTNNDVTESRKNNGTFDVCILPRSTSKLFQAGVNTFILKAERIYEAATKKTIGRCLSR